MKINQSQRCLFINQTIVQLILDLEKVVRHVWSECMARPGLYANIHAKRKRGGKMRKKGAKGAPTAANFARAKQTARKR